MGQGFPIHAIAGIGHREHCIGAGLHLHAGLEPGVRLGENGRARVQAQASAGPHRVARVQCQVEEHLFQVARVRHDAPGHRLQPEQHAHLFAHGPAKRRFHARDHRIEIEPLELEHLAPAEGQELGGDPGGPFGGPLNLLDVVPHLVRQIAAAQDEGDAAEDDRHLVVRLVGHTAREAPHRLHALGLAQPLFGHLPVATPSVPVRADVLTLTSR